jgi:hypothetical protein
LSGSEGHKDRRGPWMVQNPDAGALPDFLIIGAQKCGTTSLYRLLRQHSLMLPAKKKEVHFFDVNFGRGVEWYRSHFLKPARKGDRKTITGEASPYYLYHPRAAERAASVVPDALLIVLLRDPVDRAYSDYQDKVRRGREPLSFEEAIEAEEERLRGETERLLADDSYVSENHRLYSYLARGVYADQIREWRRFFNEDRMLLLRSEDLFGDTPETLRRVFNFLGLPEQSLALPRERRNEGSYAPMSCGTREKLRAYFEPHNRRLYEYLGTSFGW